MAKVAVIGANGQVGAELCLLLAARSDMELVPICRNRSGSGFLRSQGIACRHGRVADSKEARRLLNDCEIVINSSLANGTPADIRRIEDSIVRNMFEFSRQGATIIHFSTQSVYGDPSPGRRIRWLNPYGRVKLTTERRVRSTQRRTGKPAYILRLGHVCGSLQEISHAIRVQIRDGDVVLPAEDCSSNTVYTAAIIGAVDQIARGGVKPGTYDLMNSPLWSWREVYAYEASVGQMPLAPRVVAGTDRRSWRAVVSSMAARSAAALASAAPVRNFVSKSFAYVPHTLNARAMAWWYMRRARTEIAALRRASQAADHLSWVTNGVHYFPADKPTIELLGASSNFESSEVSRPPWPADLPDAG
jgi:dTDP-4-dehydrorhamnose reductase